MSCLLTAIFIILVFERHIVHLMLVIGDRWHVFDGAAKIYYFLQRQFLYHRIDFIFVSSISFEINFFKYRQV